MLRAHVKYVDLWTHTPRRSTHAARAMGYDRAHTGILPVSAARQACEVGAAIAQRGLRSRRRERAPLRAARPAACQRQKRGRQCAGVRLQLGWKRPGAPACATARRTQSTSHPAGGRTRVSVSVTVTDRTPAWEIRVFPAQACPLEYSDPGAQCGACVTRTGRAWAPAPCAPAAAGARLRAAGRRTRAAPRPAARARAGGASPRGRSPHRGAASAGRPPARGPRSAGLPSCSWPRGCTRRTAAGRSGHPHKPSSPPSKERTCRRDVPDELQHGRMSGRLLLAQRSHALHPPSSGRHRLPRPRWGHGQQSRPRSVGPSACGPCGPGTPRPYILPTHASRRAHAAAGARHDAKDVQRLVDQAARAQRANERRERRGVAAHAVGDHRLHDRGAGAPHGCSSGLASAPAVPAMGHARVPGAHAGARRCCRQPVTLVRCCAQLCDTQDTRAPRPASATGPAGGAGFRKIDSKPQRNTAWRPGQERARPPRTDRGQCGLP